MKIESYDIIIVGAGPGGCTCAAHLLSTGLRIAIVDKEEFPREKVCGGVLGSEAINAIERLPQSIQKRFADLKQKLIIKDFDITVPGGDSYHFSSKTKKQLDCYTIDRYYFDDMFLSSVSEYENVDVFTGEKIVDICCTEDEVIVKFEQSSGLELKAQIVVGADGANSIVARKLLGDNNCNKATDLLRIRGIYSDVKSRFETPTLELYFLKDIFPGYLWIYPIGDGLVNVGLLAKNKHILANKLDMIKYLNDIITNDKRISAQFSNANLVRLVQGGRVPISIERQRISGDRFLLVGDAASLIDPILGNGIANAMVSGEFAAWRVTKCFITNDFSSDFMEYYDNRVQNRFLDVFITQHRISEFLGEWPMLFNYAVKKFNKKSNIFELLEPAGLRDMEKRMVKLDPKFYLDLLMS